jgi:hypothetical protein
MSYTVSLKHVRYGRVTFDLVELKRRVEFRLAAGSKAPRLAPLLTRTDRLMTMIDALDDRRLAWNAQRALDAELALLLMDWDLVQAILAGRAAPSVRRRPLRALAKRRS